MTHRFRRPANTPGAAREAQVELTTYTVAQIQALAVRPAQMVYLSDGASNKRLAIGCDVWRYADGTAV